MVTISLSFLPTTSSLLAGTTTFFVTPVSKLSTSVPRWSHLHSTRPPSTKSVVTFTLPRENFNVAEPSQRTESDFEDEDDFDSWEQWGVNKGGVDKRGL